MFSLRHLARINETLWNWAKLIQAMDFIFLNTSSLNVLNGVSTGHLIIVLHWIFMSRLVFCIVPLTIYFCLKPTEIQSYHFSSCSYHISLFSFCNSRVLWLYIDICTKLLLWQTDVVWVKLLQSNVPNATPISVNRMGKTANIHTLKNKLTSKL